jgi:pimeloyl-ACP methyl ester carboxylesterase
MSAKYKIEVGEVIIECVIHGSGKTVVLLPGLGGDASSFTDLAQALANAGFRTVAINPRGVEESVGPLEELTLHDFAADIAGVIEALDAAPAHILGRAFGNRVARCLAADRPDLVRSVILLAAGGLVEPDPEALVALQRAFRQDIPEAERLEAMQVASFSPSSTPNRSALWKLWPAVAAAQTAASQATPLADWWTGGTAPLLVVQGLDDRLAPPGNGRALRDQLGERVNLVEIPNAGHALLFEQPKVVTEAIIAFLREHA